MSLVVVFAVLRSVFWVAGASRLLGGGNCGGGRGWAFPATRREMKKIVLLSFFCPKSLGRYKSEVHAFLSLIYEIAIYPRLL